MRYPEELKKQIQKYRSAGKTYREIQNALAQKIPKSTLAYLCKNIQMDPLYKVEAKRISLENLGRARLLAQSLQRTHRKKYFHNLHCQSRALLEAFKKNKNFEKVCLSLLYLAEGSKREGGGVTFGNSDPGIIRIFVALMRRCYAIDESKFRCTVQCRADQDVVALESFWSTVTGIPLQKFYKARIDPRTVGKKSRKIDYKGVCRIDYFSAAIYHELMSIGNTLKKAL